MSFTELLRSLLFLGEQPVCVIHVDDNFRGVTILTKEMDRIIVDIVILVLTLVTLFVIFFLSCLLWYCCRSKRLPKRRDHLRKEVSNDICNQYETGYVSKTENSGYLYIDSVQTNSEDKQEINKENILLPFTKKEAGNKIDLEQKKMLVTKTTVTTVMRVVDLPNDISLESGGIPVDYSKSTYLVPVKNASKSF